MKYNLYINQLKAIELGIKNIQEAVIFDVLTTASTWATAEIINNKVYYWVARQRIQEMLPILNLSSDSIYRYLKHLREIGLIEYIKKNKKDLIAITEKGKEYLIKTPMSEKIPNYYVGKNSEFKKNLEKNPRELGKFSENAISEKNPTYSTNNDSTNNSILQENKEKEKINKKEKEKTLFEKAKEDLSVQEKLSALGVDENFLFELISYREEIKAPLKTVKGVIGLLKQFAEVKALAKVGPYKAFEIMQENEWKTPKAIKNINEAKTKNESSKEFSLKELEKFGFKFNNDDTIETKILEGGSNE